MPLLFRRITDILADTPGTASFIVFTSTIEFVSFYFALSMPFTRPLTSIHISFIFEYIDRHSKRLLQDLILNTTITTLTHELNFYHFISSSKGCLQNLNDLC